jgi:hypothetical protein
MRSNLAASASIIDCAAPSKVITAKYGSKAVTTGKVGKKSSIATGPTGKVGEERSYNSTTSSLAGCSMFASSPRRVEGVTKVAGTVTNVSAASSSLSSDGVLMEAL